jgi:hypothetical protein
VVLDYGTQPPVLRCERCGETHTVRLPQSVDGFVAMSDGFCTVHQSCQAADVPEEWPECRFCGVTVAADGKRSCFYHGRDDVQLVSRKYCERCLRREGVGG